MYITFHILYTYDMEMTPTCQDLLYILPLDYELMFLKGNFVLKYYPRDVIVS